MAKGQFSHFFSLDSAKAIKAREYGYMNAINYMAPASTAGAGNVCPNASPGCLALCLGWFSGQAGIVKKGTRRNRTGGNATRKSRIAKVQLFMHDRRSFMREMVNGIEQSLRAAAREGLTLCVRLNGSSDIPWEHIKLDVRDFALGTTILERFADVQFVDYTKSVKRAAAHARGEMPNNYHLTFSRSETNEADCLLVLEAGGNVAVVFEGDKPSRYLGHIVLDGDRHDLRHLDNASTLARGPFVIGLSPKGSKAKRDESGFVVRDAA